MKERFSPIRHVPKYSKALLAALLQPMLLYFAVVGNGILLICATLFYVFERHVNVHLSTYFDALWWAFSTVTTVGYGDIVPVTVTGKVTAIFLMITGISMFVAYTGYLVTAISNLTAGELFEHDMQLRKRVSVMNGTIEKLEHRLSTMETLVQEMQHGEKK